MCLKKNSQKWPLETVLLENKLVRTKGNSQEEDMEEIVLPQSLMLKISQSYGRIVLCEVKLT